MTMLTPEEVQQRTGLSRASVYRGLNSGRIPGRKLVVSGNGKGGRWIIPEDELNQWLAESKVNSSDPMPGGFMAEVIELRERAA